MTRDTANRRAEKTEALRLYISAIAAAPDKTDFNRLTGDELIKGADQIDRFLSNDGNHV